MEYINNSHASIYNAQSSFFITSASRAAVSVCLKALLPDPPVVERAELLGQLLDVRLCGGPRKKRFRLRSLTSSRPGPPAGSGPCS